MSDLETQDTEPLTPDAQRIVELERRVIQLELRLEVEIRAADSAVRMLGSQAAKREQELQNQIVYWRTRCEAVEQELQQVRAAQRLSALQPKG